MKINEIIKERRRMEGLTQEQIAEYLGVSTPAVNKWEKGISYPDITLLPPLARLLKVDLNTLLSFNEDLSDEEVGIFTNELVEIINKEGFNIGFQKGMDKIHEYPTCNRLILTVASVLQGSIYMFGVKEKDIYEEEIEKLYVKVSQCEDMKIRNEGISMLISKYLGREEYEKAQEYINKLPDVTYDKKQLQGNLYLKSGELKKSSEIFEHKIISGTTEIITSLMSMMKISLKEGRNEEAKYFAKVIEETTNLYDLWEYNTYVAYFQLYIELKDEENFIITLKKMINKMKEGYDISKSNLYKNIKVKSDDKSFMGAFIKSFINSLKNDDDNELEFLKENKEFLELLDSFN